MPSQQQRSNGRNNSQSNPNSFFKRYEHLSQFVINSILAILTLATLIVTSVYSNKSLNETHAANVLAENAYKLNQDQWNALKREKIKEEITNIGKSKQDSIKYSKDTIRIGNRDKFQILSFERQLAIYKSQLNVFKIQAAAARKQLEYEKEVLSQQEYSNRPVFGLNGVEFDSLFKRIKFSITNLGNTPTTIRKFRMFAYSLKADIFASNNDPVAVIDLENKSSSTLSIPSTIDFYNDKNAIYYMEFEYLYPSKTSKKFVKYFFWERQPNNIISWMDVKSTDIELLKQKANEVGYKF